MKYFLATALALLVILLAPVGLEAWRAQADRSDRAARAGRLMELGNESLKSGDLQRGVLALQRARDLIRDDEAIREALVGAQARLVAEQPGTLSTETALALGLELEVYPKAGGAALRAVALGQIAMFRGQRRVAEKHFEAAVAAAADSAVARHALGKALLHRKQIPEALPHLTRAVEIAAEVVHYRRTLGRALGAADRWPRAEEILARASQLGADPGVFDQLGEAQLKQDKFKEGAESLKRAIELSGDEKRRAPIRAKLGYALFRLKDLPGAITQLRQSLRGGGDASVRYNLAVAYQSAADHRSAARLFEQAIAEDPGNGEAYVRLVTAYAHAGERPAADKALQRLRALGQQRMGPYIQAAEKALAAGALVPN